MCDGRGLAAKRVFDTGAWEGSGQRTAAGWLASVSGQSAAQAAMALKNARRMSEQPDVEQAARKGQPDVEQAARKGQPSEQQANAVSSAAEKAPEKTAELPDKSRSDNRAALRERSRDIQLAADEAAEKDRHQEIHNNRYLRFWSDLDGSARTSGRFAPDRAAAVINALVPFQVEMFDAARRLGLRERRECHAADALVAMARATTGGDTDPHPGAEPDRDAETCSEPVTGEADIPFFDSDAGE